MKDELRRPMFLNILFREMMKSNSDLSYLIIMKCEYVFAKDASKFDASFVIVKLLF